MARDNHADPIVFGMDEFAAVVEPELRFRHDFLANREGKRLEDRPLAQQQGGLISLFCGNAGRIKNHENPNAGKDHPEAIGGKYGGKNGSACLGAPARTDHALEQISKGLGLTDEDRRVGTRGPRVRRGEGGRASPPSPGYGVTSRSSLPAEAKSKNVSCLG
jgi:hypothetical protein